jgi:hypothetical protein
MARDPNHEVRKSYEKSLGPALGSIFSELWQELAWLHTVWQEYRTIFADTPARLDLANESAGSFFYLIQKSLWESVLLHLARLTDPVTSIGKPNLSVSALQGLVLPEFQVEVGKLTDAALGASAFAKDWRNRYIAHKDLPLALGDQKAPPLKSASRAAVEKALQALDDLLNFIDRAYNDTSTVFRGIEPHTGARRLLDILGKGLAAEKSEQAEFRRRYDPIE